MSLIARPVIALSALVLLAPLSPPRTADAATPARLRAAKKAFKRAEVQYRLGNFEEALGHYKAALKLARRPSLVFNIAQCYRFLEQPKKAIFFYQLYLSEWKRTHPRTPPPNRDEVMQWLAALRQQARSAEPGSVRLQGVPDRAAVYLDGKLVGRGPFAAPIELEPGDHALRVVARGHHPYEGTLTVRGGAAVTERVALRRLRGRKGACLVTGLVTGALAVGAEVAALLLTRETNKQYDDTPEFRRYRAGAIGSHVAAGTLAAAAVVSFVLYYRSGERAPAPRAVGFAPLRGGALVTAGGSF